MPAVLLGVVLLGLGVAMELNRDRLIRRVTSRSLGSLAPGYAATGAGIRVYTGLVVSIGVTVLGAGLAGSYRTLGGAVLLAGVAAFLVLSVVALVGETQTFRKLKR
jgi:hypothetical protein